MIELFIAFGAGLISFLSPCVLPLIPGYVSFITGNTLNEILEKKKIDLLPLIVFSLGFSFVFIIFGATASFLGQILLQNSQILRSIAGVIIIIFSLQLIGVLNIKFLNVEKKFYTKKSNNIFFVFIVGMAFGFGWTPCVGPALASILMIAGGMGDALHGTLLLLVYGLSMTLPFVFAAIFAKPFLRWMQRNNHYIKYVEKIMGLMLIIFALLIATNSVNYIANIMIKYMPWFSSIG